MPKFYQDDDDILFTDASKDFEKGKAKNKDSGESRASSPT